MQDSDSTSKNATNEAARKELRSLLDGMVNLNRTLEETLGFRSGSVGEAHPWAVGASRHLMEGFHAFGIADELRRWGRLPDIIVMTAECLKRVLEIADTSLATRKPTADSDPADVAAWQEDQKAIEQLGHVFGLRPWQKYQSLIPAGPPIDRTPRPEVVAAVDAVMATAWTQPTEADEASVLKADAEGRRFWAEWARLSDWASQNLLSGKKWTNGDSDELDRLADQANAMIDCVLEAPISTFRTAVTVMHLALDEETTGRHIEASETAALQRVRDWFKAQAEQVQS